MRLRADEALVTAGLCESVEMARALIMEGKALYGTQKLVKPSEAIKDVSLLRLKGQENIYVSRGAHKLKKAFEVFDISARDKACIDVGASTGGFTDVMLRQGAKKVYCVDVGYNLLDWKLRSDARVCVMEKTNARFLEDKMFDQLPEFGATDVSFISLKTVLPAVFKCLKPGSDFIALIKPQFEADKNDVGEKGVVRDSKVHINVINDVCAFLTERGISAIALDYSPIKGPEGNIEFLLWLKNDGAGERLSEDEVRRVVAAAHEKLC